MIYTSKTTPIISACSRLVWAASHQPQVMEVVERLHPVSYTHLTLPTNREV